MLIQPLSQTITVDLRPAAESFRLGAELRALVRRGDSGQPLLELTDGELLTPHSKVPLRPGAQLLLRVIQTQPVVILQIVESRSGSPTIDAALRALLPNNGSRTPLFESLAQLLGATSAPRLPPSVLTALAALTAHAHPPERLTDPARLAEALRHSGPLLESHLLHAAGGTPGQDLKAQLLRLAAQLRAALLDASSSSGHLDRSLLNALLEDSDRALARIEAQQLQALSGRGLDLLFELPLLADGEIERLQIRIQDEAPAKEEQDGKTDAGLLIRLRFEFAAIGAISAMLRINGDMVGLHWWAEQAETGARVRQALPQLEARLRALGLEVSELDCSDGVPPAIDDLPVLQTRGLLHEKA